MTRLQLRRLVMEETKKMEKDKWIMDSLIGLLTNFKDKNSEQTPKQIANEIIKMFNTPEKEGNKQYFRENKND